MHHDAVDHALSRAGAIGEDAPDTAWSEIYASAHFSELRRRRRRFIVPALGATMGSFLVFILLSAYAGDVIGASLHEGLTVGMVLLVVQYAGIYLVTFAYLRKARTEYAPLAALVAQEMRTGARSPEDSAIETTGPQPS